MQIPQLQNMQRPPTMAQPAAAPGFSGMLDNAGTRIGDAIIGANNPFGGAEDVNPDMRRQQIGMALLKMAGDVDSNARRGGSALSGLGEGITNLQQGGMRNAMMKLQGQQLQESITGSKEERENKKKMRDSLNAMLLGQVGGGAPAAELPGDRPGRIEPGKSALPAQGLSKTKRAQALFWLEAGQPEKAAAAVFGSDDTASWTEVQMSDGVYMVNSKDPTQKLKIGESKDGAAATEITDIGGKRVLVNKKDGAVIKELGDSPTKQLNAPNGYRMKDDGNIERIPGYKDTQLEMDMRKEFDAVSKDFRSVRDSYNRMQASAENPSPAGDLSLIFNYMKMLDPNSVVRESEFATAAAAGSFGERIQGAVSQVTNGQRLAPEIRADFLTRSEQLYGEQDQTFQSLADQYSETAKRNGLDPENIILTPRSNPRKPKADGWTTLPNGVKIRKKQ